MKTDKIKTDIESLKKQNIMLSDKINIKFQKSSNDIDVIQRTIKNINKDISRLNNLEKQMTEHLYKNETLLDNQTSLVAIISIISAIISIIVLLVVL